MQYSVRNRRRLKQTGSPPTVAASESDPARPKRTVPVVEDRLDATTVDRARE